MGMPPTEVPEALARKTIDASTSQPAVLFDFGLDRVTSHHYFVRLGVVPLAVVMNRKSFDALPKTAQDAIRNHSLEWINKLYVDSMLVYDKSLIDRLKSEPKRTVVFPDEADAASRADGVRACDPGMGQEELAQRRNLQVCGGGN